MRRSHRIASRQNQDENSSDSSRLTQNSVAFRGARIIVNAPMGNNSSFDNQSRNGDNLQTFSLPIQISYTSPTHQRRDQCRKRLNTDPKCFGEVIKNKASNTIIKQKDDVFLETSMKCGVSSIRDDENTIPKLIHRRSIGARRHKNAVEYCGFSTTEKTYLNNQFFLPNRLETFAFQNGCQHPYTYQKSKIFCCKFISGGDQLLTASQEKVIRVFDRVSVSDIEVDNSSARSAYKYKVDKEFVCPEVGWAIVDVAVSANSNIACYGTWSNYIYERDILTDDNDQSRWRQYELCDDYIRNCVFSLRYSDDEERILCGCNAAALRIIDRCSMMVVEHLPNAHEDDINAVVFGSSRSTFFFSGGDDGMIKVWDTRTTRSEIPVGVFASHSDGVTSLDTRGDDRYVLSSSKDQTIKLWDVRKFSSSKAIADTRKVISRLGWDYRIEPPPNKMKAQTSNSEFDSSILTFSGYHTVRHTLIRCYFSPDATTGQRYIYTGSAKGQCIVYDILTGEYLASYGKHGSTVREPAWSPNRQEIVTAGWDNKIMSFSYQEQDFDEITR